MTTSAPAILLIHTTVFMLIFVLKRLISHDMQNQYVTEPALTERMIGATLHVCGASLARPKKAKRASMMKTAPGFEKAMATA